MPAAVEHLDAIVLRTVKYGESDTIVHLFTRTRGRINAIASRARSAKSKLGARIEPFGHLHLDLRAGRGDLMRVSEAKELERYPNIRAGYELQHVAASAFDLLAKLAIEGEPNEPAYYLSANLLLLLDSERYDEVAKQIGQQELGGVVLAAYQLKLLLAMGLSPTLDACVRCDTRNELVAWSDADGGTVCINCRKFEDRQPKMEAVDLAASLVERSLRIVIEDATSFDPKLATYVSRELVSPLCNFHAGVKVRSSSFGRMVGRAGEIPG
jgi:DNA repair protein RecO (recombination protein O)